MDNLQLIVHPVSKNPSAFRMGNIVEVGFALVAFKMRHRKDGDIHNAVGSKFDEEAHIARSTSAAVTLNVNKRKVSAHNATPMQYRVKEGVSDDEDFEGAQERFRCLRLDTKVDELDEAMNKMYIASCPRYLLGYDMKKLGYLFREYVKRTRTKK
ncbi:hypothetical protein C8R44DRAFT_752836 [Mycena epipterygia]|nr:hypothetical protein C8R44DRAFT_752836 [Mycena epipterygia]